MIPLKADHHRVYAFIGRRGLRRQDPAEENPE
jgi:hypothetical protein